MKLRAWVYTRKQLSDALENVQVEFVYAPMNLLDRALAAYNEKIVVVPPEYLADCEEKVVANLTALYSAGFHNASAHTVGHIELLQNIGFKIFGGHRLNVTNSETIRFLQNEGIEDIIISPELTKDRINKLARTSNIGFLAYGKLPLMINRRCPISNGKPCNKERCGKQITDRLGNRLDVICSENTVEILNSDTLLLSDKLGEFNLDYAVLRFTTEDNINEIIEAYSKGTKIALQKLTRGLYYRGVE